MRATYFLLSLVSFGAFAADTIPGYNRLPLISNAAVTSRIVINKLKEVESEYSVVCEKPKAQFVYFFGPENSLISFQVDCPRAASPESEDPRDVTPARTGEGYTVKFRGTGFIIKSGKAKVEFSSIESRFSDDL